ncbi:MAG: hypothetical protein DRP93_08080, partial [Candidatus Neomarinimicrobiota bacterium]
MSTVQSPKYKDNAIFNQLLSEHNNDYKSVEAKLIELLSNFTDDPFDAKTWKQDIAGKAGAKKAYFGSFKKIDNEFLILIRLWVILESNAKGDLCTIGNQLSQFIKFLSIKKLNLKNVKNNELKAFEEYLDKLVTKKNTPLKSITKYPYYEAMLSFFTVMQGHPFVSKIENISAFENPYRVMFNDKDAEGDEEESKEIPEEKLNIMDEFFSQKSAPLINRVQYWLMRMYGARPEDILSYPLDCIKMFNEELATMKTYVGKQKIATHRIDPTEKRPYKIEFMNLKEPMQKMLYELIKKQQESAEQLQSEAIQKNFLMTLKYYNPKSKKVWVKVPTPGWFNKKWRENLKPLFKDEEYPMAKSLKHTAVSKRAVWGTHDNYGLRSFANHQSHDAINAYTKPATKRVIIVQKDIENFILRTNIAWEFKGQSVHNLQNIIAKVKENPFRHQLPGKGFCPDASSCGNHFECIGCDYLVPHPELKEYYFEQAEDYRDRANRLKDIGKYHEY